ncbi:hypothetical protein OIU76_008883 [Salix suchowensis]|nr:hypothetical protein OIU76_008883 [Salix suchowensis]
MQLLKRDSVYFLLEEIYLGHQRLLINMQASRARLLKEYKEVQREKVADPDIQLVCDDSNIFKWTALVKGPSETPFEGGVFQLAFSVPEQYPLQPPQVRFALLLFIDVLADDGSGDLIS